MGDKCGLMPVLFLYVHVPINGIRVECFEVLCFTECVHTIIHSLQRIRLLDSYRVKLPVIYIEA